MDNTVELLKIDGVNLVRGVGFCGYCKGKSDEDDKVQGLVSTADMVTRNYVCSVECLENLRAGNTYKEKIWMWSEDDSDFSYAEKFVSKEKAIKNALWSRHRESNTIYIGKKVKVDIGYIDAENLLESVAQNMAEEIDWDYGSDSYLDDVSLEHMYILEDRLHEVLVDWSKEFKYEPSWFLVEDIEEIDLTKVEGE